MWFFKKKVTQEEFRQFGNRVEKSFHEVKEHNRDLENRLEVLTNVTIALCPLSKQFTELQRQFTELLKQFTNSPLNCQKNATEAPLLLKKEPRDLPAFSDAKSRHLTQLEQKGLIFIGRLQNESGSNMIPVGSLTMNLYPEQLNRRIKTTISNVLKKLVELGFVNRERRGNQWYVGLTNSGYMTIRKVLNENQLKNLIQLYEHK